MFTSISPIVFRTVKIYGLSSIAYETLISVLSEMGIDLVTLSYTLAVEGLFLLLKSSQIEVPLWVEALQDLF